MSSVVLQFLLVFDHARGKLIHQKCFDQDVDSAVLAYGQMEKKYEDAPDIDVLLVGSDSLETVKMTHPNYFEDVQPPRTAVANKYLVGL